MSGYDQAEIMQVMQERIALLEHSSQALLRSNRQMIEWVQDMEAEMEDYRENAYFEWRDIREKETDFWIPQIASGAEAVEKIVRDGCSMARFGDGEFAVIAERVRHSFQTEIDRALAGRLREVLRSDDEKIIIGIADNYGSLEKYTTQARREIRRYLKREVRKEHLALLEPGRCYYDAYVTRPYVMYADNGTAAPEERFWNLRRIWESRECIFVEGSQTRLGVGNDLFDNAESIQRILAPARNAFHRYADILAECGKQKKDVLFLLALGPTATVLAYDLCRMGYQAIDVGHVDLEYEWWRKGERRRTPVAGKYNNELPQEEGAGDMEDKNYTNSSYARQVMADFS